MANDLLDLSDDELRDKIRSATNVNYFVEDWLRELDRREATRRAKAQGQTARMAAAAAVVPAVAAAVALVALVVGRT